MKLFTPKQYQCFIRVKQLDRNKITRCYLHTTIESSVKSQHPSSADLYGKPSNIKDRICETRVRFIWPCWKIRQEVVHEFIRWDKNYGKRSITRPVRSFTNYHIDDTRMIKESHSCQKGLERTVCL